MYIVIDSNVIIEANYGRGADFHLLVDSLADLQHTLCVPKIVIEEVVAHFERTLDSKFQKAVNGINELSGLLGRSLPSSIDALDKANESQSLRHALETRFQDTDCRILDYPDVEHEDLAKRATTRRKPFKSSGEGYRDSLIWETTLSLATDVSSQVALLSKNTNDFEGTEGKLHQQLLEDMTDRELSEGKIILVPSLFQFVNDHVTPALQKIEEFQTEISPLIAETRNVERLSLAIQNAYQGAEWNQEDLGLTWEYETLYLSMVEDVSNVTIIETRKLQEGKYLMVIEADLDCVFDAFISKSDLISIEDDSRLDVIDPDWNRHYVYAQVNVPFHAIVNLIIGQSESESTAIQVLYVGSILSEDDTASKSRRRQQLSVF